MYHVICPDGEDRLKVRWRTPTDSDVKSLPDQWSCDDRFCPGGIHWIQVIEEPEELAWTVDLAV